MIDFVYIINNNFYTKNIKNKNGKYLPFFDTNIKEELIKKNVLIYTKSIGFNCIINVLSILDINNDNYNTLLTNYSLGSSNNLYFLEINNLYLFNKPYKYRDYFNYCKKNNSKYINFSIYDDLIITKNYSIFFDDFMQKINITDTETETETEIETQTEIQTENETQIEKKENVKISFKIPILWNPCLELLDILERKRISKKIFKNHYSNCTSCPSCQCNNNNHNFQFTFNSNNKINLINHFSIIKYYNYYNDPKNNLDDSTSDNYDENSETESESESESETETESETTNDLDEYEYDSENDIIYDDEKSKLVDKLIEKIVRCYSTCMIYEEEKKNIKLIGLENNMINILYYNNINEDHLYNNSLFIIK
jgi:hypothetical protein